LVGDGRKAPAALIVTPEVKFVTLSVCDIVSGKKINVENRIFVKVAIPLSGKD
jgi:hypothetical protein